MENGTIKYCQEYYHIIYYYNCIIYFRTAPNQTYLSRFFLFIDDFSARGITVVLSYPCYEEQSFRNSAALIQKLDTAFRAKENLLVISVPPSYRFPADYFYDTYYHLNKEGRSVRTRRLIQDLQASGLFTIHSP